jgi:Fur family ferric uptake transcriptional regulator
MKFTANKIAGIIRAQGHKLTPQRHTVLKVMAASHDHLTPEAIYEQARSRDPGIGRVTVYRTLDLLSELDLVCRVHADGGCRSYMMRRPAEHHHHLVCSGCGKVVDFANCSLVEIQKRLARESGFEIKDHLLEFHGLCRDCIMSSPL